MIFAIFTELETAADIQRMTIGRAFGESRLVTDGNLFGDNINAYPFDARGGADKIFIDHSAIKAQCFKNLCPTLAMDG